MAKTCSECGVILSFIRDANDNVCNKCFHGEQEATRQKRVEAEQRMVANARKQQPEAIEAGEKLEQELAAILVTTETAAGDLVITDRLGIVSAEVVIGMHLFKDIFVGVRNTIGGRSATYQKDLRAMREDAIREIKREAHELGANAVIAMDLDYQEIGSAGQSMLMLVASGTAVKRIET